MNNLLDNSCPICFVELDAQNKYTSPCNHTFCKCCIRKLSEKHWDIPCPLCRQVFAPTLHQWENEPIDVLYDRVKQILSYESSRHLMLCVELVSIVTFIIKSKDRRLLDKLLEDATEPEFKPLYETSVLNGKKYFEKIDDPVESFALAWLYFKYH